MGQRSVSFFRLYRVYYADETLAGLKVGGDSFMLGVIQAFSLGVQITAVLSHTHF